MWIFNPKTFLNFNFIKLYLQLSINLSTLSMFPLLSGSHNHWNFIHSVFFSFCISGVTILSNEKFAQFVIIWKPLFFVFCSILFWVTNKGLVNEAPKNTLKLTIHGAIVLIDGGGRNVIVNPDKTDNLTASLGRHLNLLATRFQFGFLVQPKKLKLFLAKWYVLICRHVEEESFTIREKNRLSRWSWARTNCFRVESRGETKESRKAWQR